MMDRWVSHICLNFFPMLFPLIFNQHQRIFTKQNNYNHNFPYYVELIFLDFVVLYNVSYATSSHFDMVSQKQFHHECILQQIPSLEEHGWTQLDRWT